MLISYFSYINRLATRSWILFGLAVVVFIRNAEAQKAPFFTQIDAGILHGTTKNEWTQENNSRNGFSFSAFLGAKLHPNHVLGFSTGWDNYDELDIMPIALGWRGFIGNMDNPTLFAGMDIGGGSTLLERKETTEWSKSWYEGGLLLYPSIGAKLPFKSGNNSLSISLGYKRQVASYFQGALEPGGSGYPGIPPGFRDMHQTKFLFHSLSIKAGLIF